MDRGTLIERLKEYGCELEGDELFLRTANDGLGVHYRSNGGVIQRFDGSPGYGLPWTDVSSRELIDQIQSDGPVGWWLRYHNVHNRFVEFNKIH